MKLIIKTCILLLIMNLSNEVYAQKYVKALRIEQGPIIYSQEIYWDLARWEIRPEVATFLDRIIKILKSDSDVRVEMVIYNAWNNEYSMKFIDRRVQSIKDYFVNNGLINSQFKVEGVEVIIDGQDEFLRFKNFVLMEFVKNTD
ncbi:hypothetical protein QQ020_01770 [Fulvivirgaceae bacterium BMA12]|uniref:Uncharacterized protein n=1 Tax=Agaribacillus aureus TaxID=3051825 RepID=A0ABT8KZ35_9BACT|nr:hypothetical protein [Fulvivirgaceae bacterium BMA12]